MKATNKNQLTKITQILASQPDVLALVVKMLAKVIRITATTSRHQLKGGSLATLELNIPLGCMAKGTDKMTGETVNQLLHECDFTYLTRPNSVFQ